jgi:ribosomal protein L37AE/L43A
MTMTRKSDDAASTDKTKSASCAKCASENVHTLAGGAMTCGDCGARLTQSDEPPYTAVSEDPATSYATHRAASAR